jgi:hypothetical protein
VELSSWTPLRSKLDINLFTGLVMNLVMQKSQVDPCNGDFAGRSFGGYSGCLWPVAALARTERSPSKKNPSKQPKQQRLFLVIRRP